MAQVPEIATIASEHVGAVIARARPIARGVALLSTACGGLAYLVGALVFTGSWRIAWLIVGLFVCFLPAYSLWKASRRLQRAARSLISLPAALASLANDRNVREAMFVLADGKSDPENAPLIGLGKELLGLRTAVAAHRSELVELWETIVAITTLPGLLAIGIVGSFGLLIFSVVVVIVGLIV